MSFLSPYVDWSALATPLSRLRVTSRSAGHQDGAWAQRSGQRYFFFCFLESSSTCCLVFRCGVSFLSFLVDWSSFPTPLNRKMWLLEPIGIMRGVLSRLRLVQFSFFERTSSGSVCPPLPHLRSPLPPSVRGQPRVEQLENDDAFKQQVDLARSRTLPWC